MLSKNHKWTIHQLLNDGISEHLETLVQEMQRYLPELNGDEATVVRNPFFSISILLKVSLTNSKMSFWNCGMILQHVACSLKNP